MPNPPSDDSFDDWEGRWQHPRPRPIITATVRVEGGIVERVTFPLLLVLDEGIYMGQVTDSNSYHAWFVPWEDIVSSTIPLGELRVGHP